MERIAGINELRPGLTAFIEAARSGSPVIITVNSQPQAVLLEYNRYREMEKACEDSKRLALALSVAELRSKASAAGCTQTDVRQEISEFRKQIEKSR